MTSNFSNSNELLQIVKTEKLYQNLVMQLEKDFMLANITMDLSLDMLPKDLLSSLHEKIYYLILEKFMEYLNLMYIIDVPEKSFKEIEITDVVEISKQVSFLILKREWQKVWYKSKYSS